MIEITATDHTLDKATQYEQLLPQALALNEGETDLIACISNLMGLLKQTRPFFWVGVYFARKDTLVLGPFQGPVACTRIPFGQGVCGTAWKNNETIIVPDVELFPGHIACSAESLSELVIPIHNKQGEVALVLDIDSDQKNAFDETDAQYLKRMLAPIEDLL